MPLGNLILVAASQQVILAGIQHERLCASDGDTGRPQALDLMRAVGHEYNRCDAQIVQYFSRSCILARVRGIAELQVRLGLRHPLLLERTALHEGEMSVASPLLIEPDDDACTLLLNQSLRNLHLLTTITLGTIKNMRCETVRMEAAEDIFTLVYIAHHNGDNLLLPIVVQDLQKGAKLGAQRPFGETNDHDELILYSLVTPVLYLPHRGEGRTTPPYLDTVL